MRFSKQKRFFDVSSAIFTARHTPVFSFSMHVFERRINTMATLAVAKTIT
jgi:hypothetical protein